MGLYSGTGPQLLYTNTDNSITTYRSMGNKSSVTGANDVNYNIAVRIHFGKCNGIPVCVFKVYFICVCMCVHRFICVCMCVHQHFKDI